MKTTTILEQSSIHEIAQSTLFKALVRNKVKPLENKYFSINGFRGRPYNSMEVQNVITLFKSKNKAKEPKKVEDYRKYSFNEVLEILRKNPKHYLWNKQVTKWTIYDWKEFEKIEKL